MDSNADYTHSKIVKNENITLWWKLIIVPLIYSQKYPFHINLVFSTNFSFMRQLIAVKFKSYKVAKNQTCQYCPPDVYFLSLSFASTT